MEIFEAIHTRQSIAKVKPDPVPRELIERALSAAVQAPNHYKVRPWHFVVLTGEAREKLGDVMADTLKAKHPEFPPEVFEKEKGIIEQLLIRLDLGEGRQGGCENTYGQQL